MRSFCALTVVTVLATCVYAKFNMPLTKVRLNGSPGVTDNSRAALLKSRAANGSTTVVATNQIGGYTMDVGIGHPPTYYSLIVDTGSSNIWCGANKTYAQTSTSIFTGQSLNITYVSGNLTGKEYLDQVTLAPTLTITNQSVGDALSFAGFQGVDGIIGFGPLNLTNGTLSPDKHATIPTVMNNLVSQQLIEDQVLGIYFAPDLTNVSDTNGVLTYGGTDPSLYQGQVTYVPLTSTYPASDYWGINVTSATYGDHTTIIPESTAGIVDSGTTLVLIADDFFATYLDAIHGATLNTTLNLVQIPSSSIPSMESLNFKITNSVLTLDVAAQLLPEDQSTLFGGVPGQRYGLIGPLGSPSGNGLDFILGMALIERYYAVFDADNERVGFAQTNNTFSCA